MQKGIITCPKCGHKQEQTIPQNACVPWYKCTGCGEMIRCKGDTCCVFCSYGDTPCPFAESHKK